ncbi:MAG: mechanosensitive ion channel family protein [Bacteroidetes bacterium]|nr:mechanosensitive ion channel family protein [Bacteroidota bacterium]
MEETLSKLLFDPITGKIVTVIAGTMLIWILIQVVQRNLITRLKDNNNRYRTKKFSHIIGYVLTILLITIVYSNKLGGLTIALGVAGAGIAFALQEVIASFAGWLAIMFGGFYKTGDRVQLGGIKGDVMDIGVLRTTIMEIGQWVDGDLYNGRIVLIANSFVFKEPVFNYSGDFPFLWDEIKIPVQYGSNYTLATTLFQEVAKEVAGDLTKQSQEKWEALQQKFLLENAQTEPMVSLIANDNWVEYTLRYVVNFKKRRLTKTALFTKILQAVEKTNGEVSFASATFQLVETPTFKVKIDQE